jgi:hypothetical protein
MQPTFEISIFHPETYTQVAHFYVYYRSPIPIEKWKDLIAHFQYHLLFTFPQPTFLQEMTKSLETLFPQDKSIRVDRQDTDFHDWPRLPSILFTIKSYHGEDVISITDEHFVEKVMHHF